MKIKPSVPGYAGKRRTPLQSMATFCRQCFGGPAGECPSRDCIFWPYRTGTISEGASRNLVQVIRQYCQGCLAMENPAGCAAGGDYLGNPACPCWPYRLGRNPYHGDVQREKLRQHAQRQLELTG